MDIDGDGFTDNLLVAAPMFFSGGWERGKVYIYRITEQVNTQHHFDTIYTSVPKEYRQSCSILFPFAQLVVFGWKTESHYGKNVSIHYRIFFIDEKQNKLNHLKVFLH